MTQEDDKVDLQSELDALLAGEVALTQVDDVSPLDDELTMFIEGEQSLVTDKPIEANKEEESLGFDEFEIDRLLDSLKLSEQIETSQPAGEDGRIDLQLAQEPVQDDAGLIDLTFDESPVSDALEQFELDERVEEDDELNALIKELSSRSNEQMEVQERESDAEDAFSLQDELALMFGQENEVPVVERETVLDPVEPEKVMQEVKAYNSKDGTRLDENTELNILKKINLKLEEESVNEVVRMNDASDTQALDANSMKMVEQWKKQTQQLELKLDTHASEMNRMDRSIKTSQRAFEILIIVLVVLIVVILALLFRQ